MRLWKDCDNSSLSDSVASALVQLLGRRKLGTSRSVAVIRLRFRSRPF